MATRGLPAWPWARSCPDDLPAAEHLLLEALRRWVVAQHAGVPALAAARLPLIAEGAGAAAAPLDRLLSLASALRSEGLGIAACPLCPHVTPSEALVLLACATAQRGTPTEALALLALWLPAPATALPQAAALGAALRRAGLLLQHPMRMPPRPWHRATLAAPAYLPRRHGGARPADG